MASTIPVQNETTSSASRMTKEGKKITYALNVIQQPERARACGSGAKSSADRRPVDPPPIVELRVFEGDGPNRSEITFCYNASFFLFATLENARTIAPGRVPPATPSFPVLTGTPVAGMAYLDRPNPAGYFIFPDLSVRHEGKYRLSFALYEGLKDPKDMDPEDRQPLGSHAPAPVDGDVTHRLEVKSSPFTVFSAKKFPGLTESTALSRMVAEQGCRVRIRRDVRMRRRENKSSKDWDDYDEEAAYEQARRTATPDAYSQHSMTTPVSQPILDSGDRPRSVSNASAASYAPPRRPSMEDMAQSYQQQNNYGQMAPPPAQSNSYSHMQQYGSTQSAQYQSQFAPPQPATMMQPPQAQYQPQSHHNYQSQSGMHMNQSYGYMPNQTYQQQPQYEQPAPVRHDSIDYSHSATEYRRPSLPQTTPSYPAHGQMMSPFGMDSQYSRSQSLSQGMQPLQSSHNPPASTPSAIHMPNGHALAPLKTLIPPTDKQEPVSPSYQMNSSMSAPLSASEALPAHNYLDAARPAPAKFVAQPPSNIGTKRSYDSTFDTKHLNQPYKQGARPSAPTYGYDAADDSPDMEEPLDAKAMSYRRADGTHRQRRVPELA